MIANTTVVLVLLGVLCSFKTGVKFDRCLAFLSFASIFFLFAYFQQNLPVQKDDVFSFVWNSSPGGDIKVDIISNLYNCVLVLPFFLMTLISVGFNAFFCFEERRSAYNAVLLFNLISLIMMITSDNFVQLLAGLFFVDILALIVVRNTEIMQSFISFNIVADMMLFTILAVINSQVESLEIQQIAQYKAEGQHLDFVAFLGLVAVFIKLGFVPFQLNFLSLQDARFHRLQTVLFLTAPASALILLLKFSPLWSASVWFAYCVAIGVFASLLCGFIGFVFVDNMRAKLVYLQMMFASLLVYVLQNNGFVWSMLLSKVLISDFLFVCAFYYIYYFSNRKKTMSQLENTTFARKTPLFAAATLLIATTVLLADNVIAVFESGHNYFLILWIVLLLSGMANFLRQAFQFISKSVGKYSASASVRYGFWLSVMATTALLLPKVDFAKEELWFAGAFFVIVLTFNPLNMWSNTAYQCEKWQNSKISEKLYNNYLAQPLQYVGRILWLLVDWVLVEKFIVGAVTGSLQVLIRVFRNFHNNKFMASLVTLTALLLLLYGSFIYGGKLKWPF